MNVLKRKMGERVQASVFAFVGLSILLLALPFLIKTVDAVGRDLTFMCVLGGFGFTMFVFSVLDGISIKK